MAAESKRLHIRITRENLPQIKGRYPYIYLERGRLEIDDSSVKWIDSQGGVIRLPVAALQSILLGPGTSVTHEAVKVISQANCSLAWVGEDAAHLYAFGISPTADTRNLLHQVRQASDPTLSLAVARRMFQRRFPEADLNGKSLPEMMGMEGVRVRNLYKAKAQEYGVNWGGRSFVPGQFSGSDTPNRILTFCNAALYGMICSCLYSCGFSPYIGFIHSGSPLPFVYDLADLYKGEFSIDLAFRLTAQLAGHYDKKTVQDEFRARVLEKELLKQIVPDVYSVLGMEGDSSDGGRGKQSA